MKEPTNAEKMEAQEYVDNTYGPNYRTWSAMEDYLAALSGPTVTALKKRITALREALEFYTNPGCCQLDMDYEFIPEEVEFGTTAKRALAKDDEKGE